MFEIKIPTCINNTGASLVAQMVKKISLQCRRPTIISVTKKYKPNSILNLFLWL